MVLHDWNLKYRLNLLKDTFNVRQPSVKDNIGWKNQLFN